MNKTPQATTITTILPPPFDWIAIPGGQVKLDSRGGYLVSAMTVDVPGFAIAKYPITNAQYQVFVDAPDGFQELDWWAYSKAAAEWRSETMQPSSMSFGGETHPRTHVTWYEAVAFCRWLSHKTGETIRLPHETEWQRAAQGDDGRLYPWGDEWDSARCKNNAEGQSIGAAPVTEFANTSGSPFGVLDMAGNVWEWCLTSWGTGENTIHTDEVRVLRGGSWFDGVISMFRTTTRASWNPDITSDLRGFRIVRTG